jgi:hypothetical protein
MVRPTRVTVVGGEKSAAYRANMEPDVLVPSEPTLVQGEVIAPILPPTPAEPTPSSLPTELPPPPVAKPPVPPRLYVALRNFSFRFHGGPVLTMIRQGQLFSRPDEIAELLAQRSPIAPADAGVDVVMCPHCGGEVPVARPLTPQGNGATI